LTGFKTYGEFVNETTPEQRYLLVQSIEAWHDEQDGMLGL
jgi:hypothetical protein